MCVDCGMCSSQSTLKLAICSTESKALCQKYSIEVNGRRSDIKEGTAN